MKTLGIHIGHDGGCAICIDGEIAVACAEERLSRTKHANGWWNSLRYCLTATGLRLSDIDLIAISNAGPTLPPDFDAGLSQWSIGKVRTVIVDHHLSHSIAAFAFSGFDDALVAVCDAGGNCNRTESMYLFDRSHFEVVLESSASRPRCKGLGTTYEAFTNFLGFNDEESGKTMALAAFGNADRWSFPLFDVDHSGQVLSALNATHQRGVAEFAAARHFDFGEPFAESSVQTTKDVAAYIQREFTSALCTMLANKVAQHSAKNIVLSGGCALNCVTNSKTRDTFRDKGFSAFPASSDTGLPVGNCLYAFWKLTGRIPTPRNRSMRFGRNYSTEELIAALERRPDTVPPGGIRIGDLVVDKVADPVGVAAELLFDNRVVGWWQGRSECGPRALGGRSILANPRSPDVRQHINAKLKHREWFRPFGPSVLEEDAPELLRGDGPYPYMVETPYVTGAGIAALAECVHIDGTSRVQTVNPADGDRYGLLLRRVKEKTGIGAVLNTSFNVKEPIVETPGDAIATFLRSRLDALVIDDYLCTRK